MPRTTRSSSRTSSNKRKPFGERTTNQSNSKTGKGKKTPPPKEVKKKRKIQRRKSRQIGDDVVIYIQEKKSKSGKLFRAHVDSKTGGVTFVPANRKTPIAYDRHRHLLIEKTPEGDEVEVELDTEADKENIEIHSSNAENVVPTNRREEKMIPNTTSVKIKCTDKRQRRAANKKCYAESDHDDGGDDEDGDEGSDFEAAAKESPRANKRNAKKGKKSTVDNSSESNCNIEEEILSPARRIKKRSREPSTTFSSPIVKPDWEEQADWRCSTAIDY